jgi:hypothetical protein
MAPAVASRQPIQVPESEAARLVGVCTRTLFNERRAGRIKFGRVGEKVVYRVDELDRWSRANEV